MTIGRDHVIQHLQEVLMPHFLGSDHDIEVTQKSLEHFAAYLRKKYPDYKKYALYDEIDSTKSPKDEEKEFFDFPGEDSIQKFIEQLPASE